jgi:hypothetical protein
MQARPFLEQLDTMTAPSRTLPIEDGRIRLMIMKMLVNSSLLDKDSYGIGLKDGFEDLLLRFVVEYL